jgi:hypothetical protein
MKVESPVLFIVFNRPETTRVVFDVLRKVRPARLYVAADGARDGVAGEAAMVEKVRDLATGVDWPCELRTRFLDDNVGCRRAVGGAISWFFEHETQGVVLEDDCVPHPDFFRFCDELLARYAEDDRVSVITGDNFQAGEYRGEASYYFSRYTHCWGWATWRRAWANYRANLPFWAKWRDSDDWKALLPDHVERRYWRERFDLAASGAIDAWGYSWTACVWYGKGLTATPNVNLVRNIGFGEGATHTTEERPDIAAMPLQSIGMLTHPADIERDEEADRFAFDHHFGGRDMRGVRRWIVRVRRIALRMWRMMVR